MRRGVLSAVCATGLLSVGLTVVAPVAANGSSSDPFAAVVAGAQSPAVLDCGQLDPADDQANPDAPPAPTLTHVVSNLAVSDFVVEGGDLYVLSAGQQAVKEYDLSGNLLQTTPLGQLVPNDLAVDPNGNIYVIHSPYDLVKLDGSGDVLWDQRFTKPVTHLFGHVSPQGWLVGVGDSSGTDLYDMHGNFVRHVDVVGQRFNDTPDGGLVAATGSYVYKYDSSYQQQFYFGDSHTQNDPMPEAAPLHFYLQGGVVVLPDGRFLVASSGQGIYLVSQTGVIQGMLGDNSLGLLTQNAEMQVVGSTLYFASGAPFSSNQSVTSVPVSQVVAAATAPGTDVNRLGFGAGITSSQPGRYFPAGTTPTFQATFDGWWSQLNNLSLRYSVRSAEQVQDEDPPVVSTIPVDASAIRNGITINPGVTTPGAYQADFRLMVGTTAISATCVHFTVGTPAMHLDMASLPGGAGAGGPDGARGIALADLMGSGADRISLVWSHLLDSNGNLTFNYYDPEIQAAYNEEQQTGVPFSVQLGAGSPESRFVADGTWGDKVLQIIRHYAGKVDYWEAWNEPNITGYTAATYVNKILKPVYEDVQSADPTAKVIGGTVVGIGNYPYWQQIADAGGFNYMDIAAIHPYPGADRSLEEEGFANRFQLIKNIAAAAGKPDIPFWVTELAWWSNGPANWYGQANNSARGELWFKAEGIPVWEYFIAQSSWGNSGQEFSAISTASGDVKPVMLALMNQHAILGNRAFQGWITTGIPDTYAQQYGTGSGGTVDALWTDDLDTNAVLTADSSTQVTETDEYGATHTLSVSSSPTVIPISGSVTYLSVPAGVHLTIGPTETYGTDLALSSGGATATASSSNPLNAPNGAIDGMSDARGQGDFRSSPAWASGVGDVHPTLTVQLPQTETINRVLLATGGIDSVQTGIRNYDVEVQAPNGQWSQVGSVSNNFYTRTVQTTFPATRAQAVRIRVTAINFSGYAGGAMPTFWPMDSTSLSKPSQPWYGPAIIRELQVYAPGTVVATGDPSPSPSGSPTPSPSGAPTSSPTSSPTGTPTGTPSPSGSPTGTPTPAPTGSSTGGAPLPPENVQATATGPTAGRITWSPPSGATPAGYTVQVGDDLIVNTSESLITVDGLKPASTQPVAVTADFPQGSSSPARTTLTTPHASVLTMVAKPSIATAGKAVRLVGMLKSEPFNAPGTSGQLVTVETRSPHGNWHILRVVRTGFGGAWQLVVRVSRPSQFRAVFGGTAAQAATATGGWALPVRPSVRITSRRVHGRRLQLRGKVSGGLTGAPVALEKVSGGGKHPAKRMRAMKVGRLNRSGHFSFTTRLPRGRMRLVVRVAGVRGFRDGYSGMLHLRVR